MKNEKAVLAKKEKEKESCEIESWWKLIVRHWITAASAGELKYKIIFFFTLSRHKIKKRRIS